MIVLLFSSPRLGGAARITRDAPIDTSRSRPRHIEKLSRMVVCTEDFQLPTFLFCVTRATGSLHCRSSSLYFSRDTL